MKGEEGESKNTKEKSKVCQVQKKARNGHGQQKWKGKENKKKKHRKEKKRKQQIDRATMWTDIHMGDISG